MSELPEPQSGSPQTATVGRFIETALLVVLLSTLVLLGTAQIVLRNFFSIGLTWADGLTRLIVLWLALLGALAASRDARHITLDAVTRWLPPRIKTAALVIADLFAVVVCGAFAWYSASFVRATYGYGDTLLNGVPAWLLQSIMPVAFGLLCWRFLQQAVQRLRSQ